MKKMLMAIALSVAALSAIAEPSFDQMQTLIEQHQYAAAEQGLAVILQAHPTSAKAFYSMAQAQAGLGHLDKAQLALNKAQGLDPELKFASDSQVKDLRNAITPQVAKIDKIEESHFWRNVGIFFLVGGLLFGVIAYFSLRKQKPVEDDDLELNAVVKSRLDALVKQQELAKEQARKGKIVQDMCAEARQPKAPTAPSPSSNIYTSPVATQTPPAPPSPAYTPAPVSPTIVNNHYGSNNDGFVTGMLVGEMMSDHHHTTVIERDVVVERPVYVEPTPRYTAPEPTYTAPSRSSSWDDTPSTPSRSSSWDDDSSSRSSSSSSSWSSSDSSSSSSSWDSSSSDSSSSSSWDN